MIKIKHPGAKLTFHLVDTFFRAIYFNMENTLQYGRILSSASDKYLVGRSFIMDTRSKSFSMSGILAELIYGYILLGIQIFNIYNTLLQLNIFKVCERAGEEADKH